MINQHSNFLSKWAILTLIFILTVTGCGAGNVIVPTTSSVPEALPSPGSVEPTPTSAPISQENVLYQDDFTNPATGWTEEKFDNYFIGYHEPEYYHVELTGSNYKDRKSTRLNSSHSQISYAVFCLKKKKRSIYKYDCLT